MALEVEGDICKVKRYYGSGRCQWITTGRTDKGGPSMDGLSDLSPTRDPFSSPTCTVLLRLCLQCFPHYPTLFISTGLNLNVNITPQGANRPIAMPSLARLPFHLNLQNPLQLATDPPHPFILSCPSQFTMWCLLQWLSGRH